MGTKSVQSRYSRSYRHSVHIERSHIEVSGIPVEIVRKDIKNLHLGVYPPNGRVRVAVPLRVDDEAVRLAVVSRLGWIRKQQQRFEEQVRQSAREMVTGESHYYQGKRYRLNIVEHDGPPAVSLPNNTTLELRVRPGTDRDKREALLQRWYRECLREHIPPLIAKWEPEIGVTVAEWRIKKMKTRWGTCNIDARRIWLNLELAKKPSACLEYVLVHEMVHLLERRHNDRFRELMDTFMPQWRLHREELNRAPLAHEEWGY
jgi:predicted metal-dependent hydrolase